MRFSPSCPTACAGITLTEVLVALAIVSISAITYARFESNSRAAVADASHRAVAVRMAAELVDLALRGGLDALPEGVMTNVVLDQEASTVADCFAMVCTGPQVARFDLARWYLRLSDQIRGVQVRVCRDHLLQVALRWECDADPAAPRVLKLGWPVRAGSAPEAPALAVMLASD